MTRNQVKRGQKLSRNRRRAARHAGAIRDTVLRARRAADAHQAPQPEKRLVRVFRRMRPPEVLVGLGSVFTLLFESGRRY